MPEYIASATTPAGRRITEFVEAPSVDAVVAAYERRGCRDVLLHWDDVMATLTTVNAKSRKLFTPREFVRMTYRTPGGVFLFLVAKLLIKVSPIFLLLLAVIVFGAWRAHGWTWSSTAILLLPLAIGVGMVAFIVFGLGRSRRALISAVAWGRWEEVQRRLARAGARLPALQRIQYQGLALAGLGDLEAAEHEAERLGEEEIVPQWLYWAVLSDIYQSARDEEKVVEAKLHAVQEAPDNPTLLLSLAGTLVLYKRDTQRGRQLLREAKEHAIAEVIRYGVAQVEGMIALEDGDARMARDHLERALREAAPVRQSPMFVRSEGVIRAYLCLACSQLGDYEAALSHYRKAEPILRALRGDNLMSRCRQAAGV